MDDPFIGINIGPDNQSHEHLVDFGIKRVRIGTGAWTGGGDLAEQDALVEYYSSRGYIIHSVINYRGTSINLDGTNLDQLATLDINGPIMAQWISNYKAACKFIMNRYKGKISNYICGNEPDLHDDFTGLAGRPDVAVKLTKAMFEASNEVAQRSWWNPHLLAVPTPAISSI